MKSARSHWFHACSKIGLDFAGENSKKLRQPINLFLDIPNKGGALFMDVS
jgi:hypothetical protein